MLFARLVDQFRQHTKKLVRILMDVPFVGYNIDAKRISFHPIGYMESCFVFKNGTPRQGLVAPEAPAKLKILTTNAFHSLQGLDQYSHAWIVFWFHDNVNIKTNNNQQNTTEQNPTVQSETKQHEAEQNTAEKIPSHNSESNNVEQSDLNAPITTFYSKQNRKHTKNKEKQSEETQTKKQEIPVQEVDARVKQFDETPNNNDLYMPYKHKVRPPRLNGAKVGLFASRTPHRPVPIGLTLARIEKVIGDTIYFKGADLIDGTPVIDVKPYIPQYDSIPDATTPQWVTEPSQLTTVAFTDCALQSLNEYLPYLKHFNDVAQLRKTIEDVVLSDIRSVYRKKKCADEVSFHVVIMLSS
eukprot:Phypoly_transcript_10533.p1 GENE.Phypoly_transcript_10533~~Phypoly_transcript_10533.p1  ORF type:complete len:355 (+),score=31.54 Phypoly_transcript_10533:68-1132(+)